MNKIRKFYRNNRIYCILMIISIICVISIGTAAIIYFVRQTSSSEYGTRLDDLDKYDTKEDLEKINSALSETEKVTDVKTRIQGKIIYINIYVEDDTTKEQAQNMGVSTLDLISEENKNFFDIQYIIMRPSYDAYCGSKSANNLVITWARTYDTSKNEEQNEKN